MSSEMYAGSLAALLMGNPLGTARLETARRESREHFSDYLAEDFDESFAAPLHRFACTPPWSYLRSATIKDALDVLERDPARTQAAIRTRKESLARGLDGLLAPSSIWGRQDSLYEGSFTDAGVLLLEFHPEYLRIAEHVFGNLACLYWSVLKKRSVEGRFDLPSAIAVLSNQGSRTLVSGYEDFTRNAVAHGGVQVGWPDVQYVNGGHTKQVSAREFLHRFDDLWMTANSLAAALLLYVANRRQQLDSSILPAPIQVMVASSNSSHPGLHFRGALESDFEAVGRQLHIGINTDMRARNAVLLDCGRIAANLTAQGLRGYNRMLFTVGHPGSGLSDFVVIRGERLRELLEAGAPFEMMPEAFDVESTLTWHSDGWIALKYKKWRTILRSTAGQAVDQIRRNLQSEGMARASGRYVVREVKNISTHELVRVKATVVLRNPKHGDEREVVDAVLRSVTRKLRRRLHRRGARDATRQGVAWRRPRIVIVSLYRHDGPLRWLDSGGWRGGNVLAVSERTWRAAPVQVKNPEKVAHGMRIQYSMR